MLTFFAVFVFRPFICFPLVQWKLITLYDFYITEWMSDSIVFVTFMGHPLSNIWSLRQNNLNQCWWSKQMFSQNRYLLLQRTISLRCTFAGAQRDLQKPAGSWVKNVTYWQIWIVNLRIYLTLARDYLNNTWHFFVTFLTSPLWHFTFLITAF